MIRKWVIGTLVCSVLAGGMNAFAESVDFDRGVDVRGLLQSLQEKVSQETASEKAGMADWTVMVYVNAKNDLEKNGLRDVNEMERVGSSDQVKIVVALGRMNTYDHSDGAWKGERRYVIAKDTDTSRITSPVLQQAAKSDMGDWKRLVDFVRWAQKTAPARHYMLIVWSHGAGWYKSVKSGGKTDDISYDEETGSRFSIPDMDRALAAIGKVDVYASDACLMQMAEVAYQIRDYADYIVGSEERESFDGYTYHSLLGPLSAKPAMSSLELAKLAVKSFTNHYASTGEASTLSAIQSSALSGLLPLLERWTRAVRAANEISVVKDAHTKAQWFATSANKDLLHFIQLIDGATKDETVRSRGAALEKFISEQVIVANGTNGDGMANAKGLAVYLPNYVYDKNYDELSWAKDSTWPEFAQWAQKIHWEAVPVAGAGTSIAHTPMQGDLILIEKKEHQLTVYSNGNVIRVFTIDLGMGGLRKKQREGDNLTPEGIYKIDSRNPKSRYHLALHITYPNKDDVAAAKRAGVKPGDQILIHGYGVALSYHKRLDWTYGCIALTDKDMEELWSLVPNGATVEIRP